MLDPDFLVAFGHVINANMVEWKGHKAAGNTLAEEGSTELALFPRGHENASCAGESDIPHAMMFNLFHYKNFRSKNLKAIVILL